jgi:hypothetical protein
MQPTPGDDFVEVARARDEVEAIMVSRMLSSLGIRVAGVGRSIQVPRSQYSRAHEQLRHTKLAVGDENEAFAYASDRARLDEWTAELRRYRLPYLTSEIEHDGRPVYVLSVAVPDVDRSRALLVRSGLASPAELEPPGISARSGRWTDHTRPDVKAETQVELVSHAALWVVAGLFLVGVLVGLLGFLVR